MEQLKEENTWLWRAYAESDKNGHDEYCGGKNNYCFWCQRKKAHPSIYSVTNEDIELFKVSCGKSNSKNQ